MNLQGPSYIDIYRMAMVYGAGICMILAIGFAIKGLFKRDRRE